MSYEARQPNRPGVVRDAIIEVLAGTAQPLSPKEIHEMVSARIGETPASSIRSYLQNNSETLFNKVGRAKYEIAPTSLAEPEAEYKCRDLFKAKEPVQFFTSGLARVYLQDCLDWLEKANANSIHAVVTDPPYGLVEYTRKEQEKLRSKQGGVWRIPPSFDGHTRSPLPRFTTLTNGDLMNIGEFFKLWGQLILRVLVPGANVVVATNPLVSHIISMALAGAGLERRGEIVRLVMTMRGGDRPKAAHEEFPDVSVLPRSMWEPWLVFRKPVEGRIQDNLRKWKTGGFRRPDQDRPFGDVIRSSPTRASERQLAPHPSLKPQEFLRQLVRGVLPLGEGVVLDTFSGAGSTLAAANYLGYDSVGLEIDPEYYSLSKTSIPALQALKTL
jgi:site-specific DNA-methyltransferase (adenine-specific)